MGIFKILNNGDSFYISFNIIDDEISIYALNFLEKCLAIKIDASSESVLKWAENLQQSPDNYVSNLVCALKEQLRSEKLENDHHSKSQNTETGQHTSSSQKNVFEIDGNHLIWKQHFHMKKILGRKGKFLMEERPTKETTESALDSLMRELSEKETKLSQAELENERLVKENKTLSLIAEKSVSEKVKFEKEIYGKFCSLLNAKKEKNFELRSKLESIYKKDGESSSSNLPSTSVSTGNGRTKVLDVYDSDTDVAVYDSDTDVDSASEDEKSDREEVVTLSSKRKETSDSLHSDFHPKKSKIPLGDDGFTSNLNDSQDDELKMIFRSLRTRTVSDLGL